MFRFIRRHASYANVVASLALFVALGGTGYAALKLPHNSVGAKQIRKGAVDTAELHYRSVTAAKLGTDSLQPRHVSPRLKRYLDSTQPAGPPGRDGRDAVTFSAEVDGRGVLRGGNALRVDHERGTNRYRVVFPAYEGGCTAVAAPASFGIPGEVYTPGGRSVVMVPDDYATGREVSTYGPDGKPTEDGFHLIVAC